VGVADFRNHVYSSGFAAPLVKRFFGHLRDLTWNFNGSTGKTLLLTPLDFLKLFYKWYTQWRRHT